MKLTQTLWETWFVASMVIVISLMFVGMLDNSKDLVNLPYYLVASVIHAGFVTYKGLHTHEDTKE